MCGRITATFEFSDIRVRWNLERDLPRYTPRFNNRSRDFPDIPVIGAQRMQAQHAAIARVNSAWMKIKNSSGVVLEINY